MTVILTVLAAAAAGLYIVNFISYKVLNKFYSEQNPWDLNICCGRTEYGRVNADIFQHDTDISSFILTPDIYNLPFRDSEFRTALCAHTIEHVDDPEDFDRELRRVSEEVTYIVPPIWDIAAQCNIFEHKWFVLALRKKHNRLPILIPNPVARVYQNYKAQEIKA